MIKSVEWVNLSLRALMEIGIVIALGVGCSVHRLSSSGLRVWGTPSKV